ncbi:maltodextrin glucosidase [Paucibacter sp. Y2R2-4]|uniref:maltodextrin glucosidase n=1 Tax=Paucibacter sp. Y2R2-4 TaxID=2893553 RepID=UPI0021E4F422|nr:maltodextrin glucosidase [Paucibacter sp. Y2R2-4]MCV2352033.1 maltodextrin glucosidase [Paucibacter sp. Y2R2-4]
MSVLAAAPLLLHPPIAPWLQLEAGGCRLSLLSEREQFDSVYLRSQPDNEEQLILMHYAGRCAELHRWEAFLPWDSGNPLTLYAFKVLADGTQYWLAADGAHEHLPPEDRHFRIHPSQMPPAWVRDQVFYQIFPDRFYAGKPAADRAGQALPGQAGRVVVQPEWPQQQAPVDLNNAANSFYGGDLAGVTAKLDYLQNDLGVSAVYLNPIFASGSNHKYDSDDYTVVDEHLGGNAALEELSAALHQRGMRLLLDGVVNHTGVNHRWFKEAKASKDSPYRSFYLFDAQGYHFGWKGFDSLPVLNFATQGVQDAVYAAPDSVLRRWLQAPYNIDGWRLDVIHMLGEGSGATNNSFYLKEFRQAIKSENAQAYVLGEHFSEATRWLQGDQEDGAMNYYGFAHPVRSWLAGQDVAYQPIKLSTTAFTAWLDRAQACIPFDNQLAQLNLLDSHDTTRFFTLLNEDTAAMKLAATLLFSRPGTPCIYYGDEIGLAGGPDPDCRRPFIWDREQWNQPLFAHYQALIRLRQSRGEWRHGAVQTLFAEGDCIAYARHSDWEASLIVVNRGAAPVSLRLPVWKLPVPVKQWQAAWGQEFSLSDGHVQLELPARSSAVLLSV